MPFLLVVPLLAMPLSAAQVASPVDAALATLAAALEGDDQTSVRSAFSPDYRPPPGRTAEEARTAWAEALRGVSGRRVQMSADRVETGPSSCGGAIVATSRWTVVGSYKDQVFGRAEQTVFSFAQQGGRLVVVSTSRVPAPP